MPEPVNPEVDRKMREAIAHQVARVGSLHSVERSFPYEDPQLPFIAFTFSWMEPDEENDGKFPDVAAMTLYVPEVLVPPIARALSDLTATGQNGSPRKAKTRRRPKR
jgi:hypothetical protein